MPREEDCPEYEPDTDQDAGWDPDTAADAGGDAAPLPTVGKGGCACTTTGAASQPTLLKLISWLLG